MAILKGASGAAAELYFQLGQQSNPNSPVVGQDFTTGNYVYTWFPSTGLFAPISPSQIFEKGLGTYAVRSTSLQTAQDGTAYIYAEVPSVSQPFRDSADIVDPASPARYELPFTVLPLTDPIYDVGGLGIHWPFSPGQVQTRFSLDVSFSNTDVGQIVERGFNMYAVLLTPSQRATQRNAALVAFNASGMVPQVAEWDMYLNATPGPPAPPAPGPIFLPTVPPGNVDQVAAALNRIVAQFRS